MMDFRNKFYLLRHGDTDYQGRKKDFIYPANCIDKIPLSEKGVKEVEESAEGIRGVDLIYSSDFLRTRQTALIVKEKIRFDGPIIFDVRLRDLNLGVWHGRRKKEFYNKFPIEKESFFRRPEEGESWNDLEQRIFDFILDVDSEDEGKKILIISHRDPLWLLLGKINNIGKEKMIEIKKDKNKIKTAELIKLN